jgi:hypothetical protein
MRLLLVRCRLPNPRIGGNKKATQDTQFNRQERLSRSLSSYYWQAPKEEGSAAIGF